MGWFSPIKGHYPSLGQIDKTLPLSASSSTTFNRGMILKVVADTVSAEGAFEVATTVADGDLLYISLQDYRDAQAGMAGTVGFDSTVTGQPHPSMNATAGVPAITGLSIDMEGEYETDQYDATTLADGDVGTPLTVANGLLTKGTTTGIVGYLTAKPYSRWINNAGAKPADSDGRDAVRQGANRTVIRFRTK